MSFRDDDPLSTILDNYTNNNSKLHRQLSVTDADLKANPFAEEELLFKYPEEERRRRTEVESRETTPRKSRSRSGTPVFESLDAWRKRIDGLSPLRRSVSVESQSIRSESTASQSQFPRKTFLWQPLQRFLDSMFRWLMFWIFMVFWTIKEAVITVLGVTLKVADFLIATPAIILLTRLQSLIHFMTGKNLVDEELLKKARQPSTSPLKRLARIAPFLFVILAISVMVDRTEMSVNVPTPTAENIKLAFKSVPHTIERLVTTLRGHPQSVLPRSMEELASRMVSIEKYTLVLAETAQKLRQNDNRLEKLERADAKLVDSLNIRLTEVEKMLNSLSYDTGNTISAEFTKYRDELEEAIIAVLAKDQRIKDVQTSVMNMNERLQNLVSVESSIAALEKKLNELKAQPNHLEQINKISKQLNDRVSRDETKALVRHQLAEFKAEMLKRFKDTNNADLKPDAMDVVTRMIDNAIIKYHQDYLALPDYALASSGARIIPRLTSATYQLEPTESLKRIIHKLIPFRDSSSAITVLHPETNVGRCWPMLGNNGSIGILLSKTITVTGVTIEHAGTQVLTDRRSAPKDFAVWGVYGEHLGQQSDAAWSEHGQHVIELATGQYDAHDPMAVQSFPVAPQKPTRIVVIRILDNWGHPDYTCLYRIRVHGEPTSTPA
jgi:hypothetical protein